MLRATVILGLLLLGGCDVVLSLAQTAGKAGLDHTLGGYVHRTVTEPMPIVRVASKRALANMAVKIKRTWKAKDGWHVEGEAHKRVIEIWLEPLSKQTTMIRVVVNKDIISKDGATANEVIEQAVHALNVLKAQAMLSRLGYKPGSVDGMMGPQTREAIISFQNRNRLLRDGEVTPNLLTALERGGKKRTR